MSIVKLVSGTAQPLVVGKIVLGVIVGIVRKQIRTNYALRLLIQIHCDTADVGWTPIHSDTENVKILKVCSHLCKESRLIVSIDIGDDTRFTHS